MDVNRVFKAGRAVAYGLTSIIAVPLLVLGIGVTDNIDKMYNMSFGFDIQAIVTSSLTILSLPLMLWLSYNRQSAFPNMVLVELFWTTSLWILWLCAGATSASNTWVVNCGVIQDDKVEPVCIRTRPLTSMAILGFTFIFCVNISLWALAFLAHSRGNVHVWSDFVLEIDYDASRPKTKPPLIQEKDAPVSITIEKGHKVRHTAERLPRRSHLPKINAIAKPPRAAVRKSRSRQPHISYTRTQAEVV